MYSSCAALAGETGQANALDAQASVGVELGGEQRLCRLSAPVEGGQQTG